MRFNLITAFILSVFCVHSQSLPLKWYFGYKLGLNFTKGSPYIIRGQTGVTAKKGIANQSMYMIENEPFLVTGDENGNVLFYSDGRRVWNDNYWECDSILKASRSHSQILGVQLPESDATYLLLTPNGTRDIVHSWSFTEIEIKNKIKVTKTDQIFAHGKFMQGATIVPHCNGRDYWAVLHKVGNENIDYYSFLIDRNGIQKPVISKGDFDVILGKDNSQHSQISVSSVNNSFNVIATAFYGHGKNGGVELMDFDNKSGKLKRLAWLDNFTDPSDVYGVCFSPNDSLLYVTECEGEKVNQFRVYYNTESKINASRMVLHHGSQTSARFGQIQMGPDSCLYIPSDFNGMAYDLGCNFIGVIKKPNELAAKANWLPEEICVPVEYKMHTGLGLPSFNKFHKDCPQEKIMEVGEEPLKLTKEFDDVVNLPEKGDTIILPSLIFPSASFELTDSSKKVIDEIYLILLKNREINVLIEGHTDNVGEFRKNLKLSQNRALAVKNYLIQRGVSATRLRSRGYGEKRPKKPNINKKSMAINRRVEFIIY